MLKINEISKKYGKQIVLEDITINFEDPHGVYGILGRNGVGKTTLMKIMFNMISQYSGTVYLNSQNTKEAPELLTEAVYVGGQIYENNMLFQGKISNLLTIYSLMYENFDRLYAEHLLAEFDISIKRRFNKLSTGNKTLVQNIFGLATRCPLTIFDEPTNGLDSVNRQKFFRFLMEDYAEYPRMILLSTHLIQEVENYLTHVIILKETKVLIDKPIEEILQQLYLIEDFPIEGKNIIYTETLGDKKMYYVYDHISSEEEAEIIAQGGKVSRYNLQTAFNYLVEV